MCKETGEIARYWGKNYELSFLLFIVYTCYLNESINDIFQSVCFVEIYPSAVIITITMGQHAEVWKNYHMM